MANLRILNCRITMKAAIKKGSFTFTHNHHPSCRFFSALKKYHWIYSYDGRIGEYLSVFDDMIQARPLPPVEDFGFLFNDILAEKTYDSRTLVLDRFKRMSAVGIPINTSIAEHVIYCYSKLQQTQHSFTVLGCCFKLGIVPPDVSIYNIILDGFIDEDRTHEAERLFKKMFIFNNNNNNNNNTDESADQLLLCEPDIVTYNTMLKGLCKVGNHFTAIALLRLMDGRGGCCKPDLVSYNTVIEGLCCDQGVVNMIDDALKLFIEMVFVKGIRPDADTYKSLIFAFSKLGRWDESHKMVKQMMDESLSVDLQIVNIIIRELCKQGNNKDALGVYNLMLDNKSSRRDKYRPNLITYKSLIQLASSRGQMSYAWELYRWSKKSGRKPGKVTCNMLLDGFINHMKEDVAIKIFSLIPKKHVDKVTHFLLTGLITRTTPLHSPSERQYNQDIKCIYLYHLYMHDNSFDQALNLFYFMDGRHKELNSYIEVYNILIFGATKCGRVDIARQLFNELSVKGLEPDEVTYTLIIRGFCREGMVKDAKRMFIRMKQSGFLSDSVVDVNKIPLCYLEEVDFCSSACVSVDMSGVRYGSNPPPLIATLLTLNLHEQFIKSKALSMDPSCQDMDPLFLTT